jgi:hypothetical protein
MRWVAAALPLFALAGCASPERDLARLWPGSRDAIRVTIDGREQRDPLPWRVVEGVFSDGVTTVRESFARGPRGGVRWGLRVEGLVAGRDLLLRVPVRAADGSPMALAVNGSPLAAGFGEDEAVVHLARDEATFIDLRVQP